MILYIFRIALTLDWKMDTSDPSERYQKALESVRNRRYTPPPPRRNWEPILVASLNGVLIGSFIGGGIGTLLGLVYMFKNKIPVILPAMILSTSLATGCLLGAVTGALK